MRRPHNLLAAIPLIVAFLITNQSVATQTRFDEEVDTSIENAECRADQFEGMDEITGKVHRVVDGDTLRIIYKNKSYSIRMIGIDTPETHYQGKTQGYWGDKATDYLSSLARPNQQITVEFEGAEKCDRFGRILGYVYSGETSLNSQIVKMGYAVNYCYYPSTKFCKEYAEYTKVNVAQNRGFFSDSSVELPYIWRRIVSDVPDDKLIGNLYTKNVYSPGSYNKVPVHARIFFRTASAVKPPYQRVDR